MVLPRPGAEQIKLGALGWGEELEKAHEPRDDSLEAVEAAHVQQILDRTAGNKRQTARILRISRPRLDRLIEKFGLTVPR